MSKSINRVRQAALHAGLEIEIVRMGASTRTAQEAADQCGCAIDQIVKSLIFQGKSSGKLYLFLLRGSRKLDLAKASALAGETLDRADVQTVRDVTGFAIGGVAPIGHTSPIKTFADEGMEKLESVWAAAGAHDAVFQVEPKALLVAANAQTGDLVEG
ncbi:MAG: YbaK/EbsC family protein [Rhizobiaceae bacterium]